LNRYLASVCIKNFLLAIALRKAPAQAKGAAVLVDKARVVAAAEPCLTAGIVAGMSEQEARALFPACHLLALDPYAVEEASLALLADFETFSPAIEWIDTGTALLDLGRLSHPAKARAIATRLIALLTLRGYAVSVGLAEARFVAHVAAQITPVGTSLCISSRECQSFLAKQPLRYLPAPEETLRRLTLLGLRTLGDFAQLPIGALADQFGALGVTLAALVRGEDDKPMQTIKGQEVVSQTLDLELPLAGGECLLHSVKELLESLCTRLSERGQLATRIRLKLGGCEVVLTFATPHRSPERMQQAITERLNALRLPELIDQIMIHLEGLVGEAARQLMFDALLPTQRRWQGIERVLERLRTKENPSALLQVVWDAPKAPVPERRAHLQDRVLPQRTRGVYLPKEVHVAVDANALPHAVRSGKRWLPVNRILETWEVKDDWWTARPLQRTYYRVMLRNGAIIRLFRDAGNGHWYQQTR
jgi:nucleotidyltransferase/DNA polymerase involved in DNA repair